MTLIVILLLSYFEEYALLDKSDIDCNIKFL